MEGGDGRGGALDMGSAPLETSSGSAPGMYVCMYVCMYGRHAQRP